MTRLRCTGPSFRSHQISSKQTQSITTSTLWDLFKKGTENMTLIRALAQPLNEHVGKPAVCPLNWSLNLKLGHMGSYKGNIKTASKQTPCNLSSFSVVIKKKNKEGRENGQGGEGLSTASPPPGRKREVPLLLLSLPLTP